MPPKKQEEQPSVNLESPPKTRSGSVFFGKEVVKKTRKLSKSDSSTAETSATESHKETHTGEGTGVEGSTGQSSSKSDLPNQHQPTRVPATLVHQQQTHIGVGPLVERSSSPTSEDGEEDDSTPTSSPLRETDPEDLDQTVVEPETMGLTDDEVKRLVADEVAKALASVQAERQAEMKTLQALVKAIEDNTKAMLGQKAGSSKEIADALKNVKLATVSTTIKPPKWEPKKKSVTAYLKEMENYFKALNIEPDGYLGHLETILPDDTKVWYNHEVASFADWDDFKKKFTDRFENWRDQESRRKLLDNRRQQLVEPTERFIYDVFELSKFCFPSDEVKRHVYRAQSALYPCLALAIGPHYYEKLDDLIEACKEATTRLEQQDRIKKRQFTVPPMSATDRKDPPATSKANAQNNKQGSQSNDTQQQNGNQRGSYGGRGRGRRGNWRGRSGSSDTNGSGQDSDRKPNDQAQNLRGNSSRGRGRGGRGRGQSYRGGQSQAPIVTPNNIVQCMKCRGYNHSIEQCPSARGVAMAFFEDGTPFPVIVDDESQETLNCQGAEAYPATSASQSSA